MGNEGWVELPRAEVLTRIERSLTPDLVAFSVELSRDPTPIGVVESYTWLVEQDNGDQLALLLAVKDPINADAPARWFINEELVIGDQTNT